MKSKNQLQVKYSFVDYEQADCQKRLDDAFDLIFDEIEIENLERIDMNHDYEYSAVIKR